MPLPYSGQHKIREIATKSYATSRNNSIISRLSAVFPLNRTISNVTPNTLS